MQVNRHTHTHTCALEPHTHTLLRPTHCSTVPSAHTSTVLLPALSPLMPLTSLPFLLLLVGPHVLLGTGSTWLHCQLWCELS